MVNISEHIDLIEATDDNNLLQFLLSNDMIKSEGILELISMNNNKKYLKMHQFEIWQGKDGAWYTYLPDDEKGRILKRRVKENDLKKIIIDYYKELEKHPCFRQVYEEWINERREFGELTASSVIRYNNDFNRFFPKDNEFCKIRLCDMTDGILERFIKKTISEKKLTPKTYAGLRLLLIGVFKYAKREKYTTFSVKTFFMDLVLPNNIFMHVNKNAEEQVFLEDEVSQLCSYLKNNPSIINLGLILLFHSGLRVGELASLKREDNCKKNIIRVQRTESSDINAETGKKITIVKDFPKTENSIREVIIPKYAQTILEQIIALNPNGKYLFEINGKRVTERMFNYHLKKTCEAIRIKPRSTHKVRKTYGSVLLSNNVEEQIVLDQLGHKQISTTRSYYYYNIANDATKKEKIDKIVAYD